MKEAIVIVLILAGVVVFAFACGMTGIYLFCMAIIDAIFDAFEK